MKADYTEVWISSAVVPLVQFADRVRAISSTRLDVVGLVDPPVPKVLLEDLEKFDEVVSWYGSNRPEFRALMPGWVFLKALPDERPDDSSTQHASDFFLQQVGAAKGIVPRIDVASSQSRRTAVIHPFSGSSGKNWPLDQYQQLARQIPTPVEWTAGPDEHMEGATRFDNLLDLAFWMRGAAAYVGNDSGISHLAAAIGLPSVVLFGPTNPSVWAPRGSNVTILRNAPLAEVFATLLSKLKAV